MIQDKVKRSRAIDHARLNEAAQAIGVAMKNINQFMTSNTGKIEIESNARQLTFALGRTLAGALFVEQAAFDLENKIEGAEEDVLVAHRWCCAREFTQEIIPNNADIIAQEAKIVFGSNAKI